MFTKLLGLQFCIKYKKGSDNRAADALSRRPCHEESLLSISHQHPAWLQEIVDLYASDAIATTLLTRLSVALEPDDQYSLRDGVIHFKNMCGFHQCISLLAS